MNAALQDVDRPRILDKPASVTEGHDAEESGTSVERGLPSVNRSASLQQRVSRVMAFALMGVVGLGMLTWYYTHALHRGSTPAVRTTVRGAETEMALPALGRVAAPARTTASSVPIEGAAATQDAGRAGYVIGNLAGEPPPLGALAASDPGSQSSRLGAMEASPPLTGTPDRRLTGMVFAGNSGTSPSMLSAPLGDSALPGASPESSAGSTDAGALTTAQSFSQQLKTPLTSAVIARRLPTQRMLLARGAFIDCTLETAVDSSLPGLVTCLTATDTFSADGRVVLLERGTKLVGETRGEVRAGTARVFIVWTEARTPTGVVAALDSPATDALGRAGVAGKVERHFWERFGAAMLLSVIDGAVQAQMAKQSGGTTVVYNSNGSSEIVGEVLKSTVNIAPTVSIASGTRVQALVARDIDFRSVYELRTVAAEY
jgi:type IV secretion system protein VirB10